MSCKHILVVEDDLAVSQSIKDVLEIQGYEVTTAPDGNAGLAALKETNPCLVLLDLMMPGANGWQFLDVQRTDTDFKNVPVVICSAYKESAKSIESSGILAKPIQLDQLINVVKSFCNPVAANA